MITIYSDPHLGLNLGANTTPASRKALRSFIQMNLNKILDQARDAEDMILCAGDFYHTHQNSEEVLYDSLWAASMTDKILAGNHDVVNIADKKGTLDIVGTVFDTRVIPCKFGEINYRVVVIPSLPSPAASLYLVPHHSTQELFEDALDKASASAKSTAGKKILITHCNYDSKFVKDQVMLNLTQRKAAYLLDHFHYIVIGHEHNYREDLDGRVIVVGSPHPTGFGDISDKYVLRFLDGLKPYKKRTWSKAHYLEADWQEVKSKQSIEHQWIKVTGEISPSQLHDLASVVRDVWKGGKPFAVKSDVKILTGDVTRSMYHSATPERVAEIIELELKNSPELYALWKEITDDQGAAP